MCVVCFSVLFFKPKGHIMQRKLGKEANVEKKIVWSKHTRAGVERNCAYSVLLQEEGPEGIAGSPFVEFKTVSWWTPLPSKWKTTSVINQQAENWLHCGCKSSSITINPVKENTDASVLGDKRLLKAQVLIRFTGYYSTFTATFRLLPTTCLCFPLRPRLHDLPRRPLLRALLHHDGAQRRRRQGVPPRAGRDLLLLALLCGLDLTSAAGLEQIRARGSRHHLLGGLEEPDAEQYLLRRLPVHLLPGAAFLCHSLLLRQAAVHHQTGEATRGTECGLCYEIV